MRLSIKWFNHKKIKPVSSTDLGIQAGAVMPQGVAQRAITSQRGYTALELMVIIGILALLAGAVAMFVSTDSSKGLRLYTDMKTISDSTKVAAQDLGGVPSNLTVLWRQSSATSAGMFNGITATNTWRGPYVDALNVDSSNNVLMRAVADQINVAIAREAANAATNGGNYTWVYYLRASNVPNPIIAEAMKKCSGVDTGVDFRTSICRATPGTGATEVGTFDVKVLDSR